MIKWFLLPLFVAGCFSNEGPGPGPEEEPPVPKADPGCWSDGGILAVGDNLGVLGEALLIESSYHALCVDPGDLPFEQDGVVDCDPVPFDLEIACSGPCEIGATLPSRHGGLGWETRVTPLTTDRMKLAVRLTNRDDRTDTHACETRSFQMLVPDRIEALCNDGPCDQPFDYTVHVCFQLMAADQVLTLREPIGISGSPNPGFSCTSLAEGQHVVTARHGDLEKTVTVEVVKPPQQPRARG